MSRKRRQLSPAPSSRFTAILTGFACAGAAWAISAGTVLAPQPADLTSPLSSSTGATAAAVLYEYKPVPYPLWPDVWTPGTLDAGTPCSTYGLPPGARTSKRIEASGDLRRCSYYDPYKAPPANAVRPLPPMPIDGGDTKQDTKAIAVTAVDVVLVISWPADWTIYDSEAGGAKPYAGQPCSDFALQAGESSHKHIQGININIDSEFRCVANTEPIYID
jgi:hypothetical protein